MKNGQLAGQPMIMILGVVVIAITLFIGYSLVFKVQSTNEKYEMDSLKTQLSTDMDQMSDEFGSSLVQEYDLPRGVEEVCLVDLEDVIPSDIIGRPLIKDSVEDGVQKNVFLSGEDGIEGFFISSLRLPPPDFYCIETQGGSIEVEMQGDGDSVMLVAPALEQYCVNAETGDICDGLDIVFYEGYKDACCSTYSRCC